VFAGRLPARVIFFVMQEMTKMLIEMDLPDAAAFWQLELLASEDLPLIAANALERGSDSPSLRILAGEAEKVASTVGPLFLRALHELGIPLPAPASAQMTVARFYARKILDGSLSPYEGAYRIWCDVANEAYPTEKENEVWNRLRVFVGIASECEDNPRFQKEYEDQIVQEAKNLLSENQFA